MRKDTPQEIYSDPQHLYTKRLISAIPEMDPAKRLEKTYLRQAIDDEYRTGYDQYFDGDGRLFDLKKISNTHSVAMP